MLEITDGLEIDKNVSLVILLDSRSFEEDEKKRSTMDTGRNRRVVDSEPRHLCLCHTYYIILVLHNPIVVCFHQV